MHVYSSIDTKGIHYVHMDFLSSIRRSRYIGFRMRGNYKYHLVYLIHPKNQKLFQNSRHIEFYGTCMEH